MGAASPRRRSQPSKAAGKSFIGLDERTTRRDYRAASVTPATPTTPKTDETMSQPKKGIFGRLFKKKAVLDTTMALKGKLNSAQLLPLIFKD
jgi:hypothetical protein